MSRELKFSKTYFKRLTFYSGTNSFIFPLSVLIDEVGFTMCFGFWGFMWYWKKEVEQNEDD